MIQILRVKMKIIFHQKGRGGILRLLLKFKNEKNNSIKFFIVYEPNEYEILRSL